MWAVVQWLGEEWWHALAATAAVVILGFSASWAWHNRKGQ